MFSSFLGQGQYQKGNPFYIFMKPNFTQVVYFHTFQSV